MTKKTYNLSVKYRKEMKDYREEYGIPQWLLAEYMGISQSLVSHFEKNKTDYLLIDKDIIDACAKKYNRKKKMEVKKELNEPIQFNIGNADIERQQNNIESVRKGIFANIDRINKGLEQAHQKIGQHTFNIEAVKRDATESIKAQKDVIEALEIKLTKATSNMYIVMAIMFLATILIQVGMYYG